MGIFNDPKKMVLVLIAPLLFLGGGFFAIPSVTAELAKILGFFFYGSVFAIYLWKKLNLKSLQTSLDEQAGSTTISKSMDLDEAMETVREWTQENYAEGNEAHFQWSSTHYETTVEKDPQTGDEYMFYAFITYGEYNRLTLFCIEGKDGSIVSHKPVRWEGMLKNPFDYVPMVQELRRKSWNYGNEGGVPFPESNQMGNAKWKSVYQSHGQGAGMPLDQNMMQQGGNYQQLPNPQQGGGQQGQNQNYTQASKEDDSEQS